VLATSNYTQWETIRKGFEKAFSADAVKQYVPALSTEVRCNWVRPEAGWWCGSASSDISLSKQCH